VQWFAAEERRRRWNGQDDQDVQDVQADEDDRKAGNGDFRLCSCGSGGAVVVLLNWRRQEQVMELGGV
jgi:hypothetical protein